jgi:aminoglycoside phosphotransferase (APT) family kinase protein
LRDFIGLFRSLHLLKWQPYMEDPDEFAPSGQPYFHFDRKLAHISQYLTGAGLTAFDPVIDWLSDRRELAACERACIVHRDFHPNNILVDGNGNLFVVDWTSAEISDYRFDLAWTLALTLAYEGNIRRQMVLEEYEQQMGSRVPNLEVFEVFACVRRIGSAMISMQNGAEKMGMRPEAAEVMRRDRAAFEHLFQRLIVITGQALPKISAWLESLE